MADNASCQNNLKMARLLGPWISYVRLLIKAEQGGRQKKPA